MWTVKKQWNKGNKKTEKIRNKWRKGGEKEEEESKYFIEKEREKKSEKDKNRKLEKITKTIEKAI